MDADGSADGRDNGKSGGKAKPLKRKCCVPGCHNTNLTTQLHTFPSNVERCKLWLSNLKSPLLDAVSVENLNKRFFVCTVHFARDQYCSETSRVLHKSAIPTRALTNTFNKNSEDYNTADGETVESAADTVETNKGEKRKPSDGTRIRRRCCIPGCNNTNLTSHLHSFPSDYERCKLWISNIGSAVLFNMTVQDLYGRYFVCSSHFSTEQYCNINSKTLKKTAVPTMISNMHHGHVNGQIVVGRADLDQKDSPSRNIEDEHTDKVLPPHDVARNIGKEVTDEAIGVQTESRNTEQSSYILREQPSTSGTNVETSTTSSRINATRSSKVKRRCCAPGCLNTNLTSRLFGFPCIGKRTNDGRSFTISENSLNRCKAWVKITGNMKLTMVDPTHLQKRFSLCALHFAESDFTSNGALHSTTVPSLFCQPPLSNFKFQQYEQKIARLVGPNPESSERVFSETSPIYCGLQFEDHMKNLEWRICENCKERHLQCSSLKQTCTHGKSCADYSQMNDMDPGEVPPELQGLSFIEEQLISQVHPVITVFKLKGLQLGYTGNVINFHQAVDNFAEELPKKVGDLTSVINVRFSSEKVQIREFQVRASKVWTALMWLKQNNPFYENISISMDNLRLLPDNGNVYDQVRSVVISHQNYSDIPNNDHSDVSDDDSNCDERASEPSINDLTDDEPDGIYDSTVPRFISGNQDDQIKDFLEWPHLSSTPIDEFNSPGYIACAFPALFPYGKADLRSARLTTIKPSNYFKHLMYYHDQRFAKHRTFRYFALNSSMRWNALSTGNVFVKINEGLDNVTVERLRDLVKEDRNTLKKIMYYGSSLRGTKAYWHTRCNELRDMIEQLSLPTFFLTLSAADLHWPDLFKLLDENYEHITEQDRRRLLQDNPMVVDNFFQLRVEAFVKYLLEKGYKVIDYWYRIEFQHRGSPHLHGVFWVENAPDVSNLMNESNARKEEIIQYFDTLVCAVNPDPGCEVSVHHPCRLRYEDVDDEEEDLAQLLRTVQRHTRCSKNYCLRINKNSGKQECRFKFPFDVTEKSYFKMNESGRLEYYPARNDEWLNVYNPDMLKVWRANMDIRPVLSKEALIAYLAKYISKCEPRSKGMDDVFFELLNTMNENDSSKKFVQKCLIKLCGERDYSAQEVCHILLGHKLYSSGGRIFTTLHLPTVREWHPVQQRSENSDVEPEKGIIAQYIERPPELENVTLWQAAKQYNVKSWKRHSKDHIVRVHPRYRLSDDESQNKNFYRQQVLLHVPWRDTEKLSENSSWKHLYEENNVASALTTSCLLKDQDVEIEDDVEQEEESNVLEEEWMVAARLAPRSNLPVIEPGRREMDVNFNWNNALIRYSASCSLEDLQNFIPLMKEKTTNSLVLSVSSTEMPNVIFNEEQMTVVQLVRDQIATINANVENDDLPKRTIIQGKAGTGKSLVIRAATSLIQDNLGQDSYVLLASTGIAALNIGGVTIHSYFCIPRDSNSFQDLQGEAARTFTNKIANVRFLIIDEFSMIGNRLLAMIDKRCRQGTGKTEEFFGGLRVMLYGDLRQLPPVKDDAIYSKGRKKTSLLSQHGSAVFMNFQKCIFLKQCHRQQDKKFLALLDNISVGDITIEDFQLLSTRFVTNAKDERIANPNSLRLFATCDEVHRFNLNILNNLKDENGLLRPIARIPAKHNCKLAATKQSDTADGLESVLYLSTGSQVMLRSNLWTAKGLVNGAVGKVADIIYDIGSSSPDDFPVSIICSFPSYTGPPLLAGTQLVPINPITVSWTSTNGTKCTRTQFPLCLAYACTIHKSQGMTLEQVVVDIGKIEFSLGLTYVALSRVKTLDGLLMHPICFDRIANLKNRPSMVQRKHCEAWLKTLV